MTIVHRRVADLRQARAAYDGLHRAGGFGAGPRFHDWFLARARADLRPPVLDLGAGDGLLADRLTALGLRALALDLSLVGLRERGVAAARCCADGERLPFAAASFGSALSLGALEHLFEPPQGLRELRRVLRPGASAFLFLPNSLYSGDLWRRILGRGAPDHHQPMETFATRRGWARLIEDAGLRVEACWRFDKFKAWKALLPAGLAYHFLFRARVP